MSKRRNRRWSYFVLHWTLVIAFIINALTGISIHFATPTSPLLPAWMTALTVSGQLITLHLISAVLLLGTCLAYPTLLVLSKERARIDLVKALHLAFVSRSKIKWTLRVLIFWFIYFAVLITILSGFSLYFFVPRVTVSLYFKQLIQ